jgi:xanthine/CO dehydrogenase XdhC/CoxF family maturation factor
MVVCVLAVLAAGLIGYALGGWLGVAVGAGSATAVSVLLEPLTPPGDRQTAHERRMRRNRRYRTRYEALEEGWRRPPGTRQRTDWKPVNRLVAEGRAGEPVLPIEIVPLPVSIAEPDPAPALGAPKKAPKTTATRKPAEPKPTAARKPRTPRAPKAARTPAAKTI